MQSFKDVDIIFAGKESEDVAKYIHRKTHIEEGNIEIITFPDTECLVEITPDIKDKNILYIKSTPYPQDKNLMELFLTIDAFRKNGAKKIELVIPYYAHARQDRMFENNIQSESAETVAKIIAALGSPKIEVYTIDAHFHRHVGDYPLFSTDIKAFNITAVKELAKHIKDKYDPRNPKIVIPDKGQQPTHKYIKEIFDTDFIFLSKRRLGSRNVEITCDQDISTLKNSDVIIFDDIIGTGITLQKSIEWLKTKDADRIFVAATHLMYPYDEKNRKHEDVGSILRDVGATEIISANTTDIKENGQISVAPLIERAISNEDFA